ncbi:MAG: hypothetical protein ABH874_01215 [Methanobacteriota archaeon]
MEEKIISEKGNALKILEWFKLHKDEEFAKVLESTVKRSREKLALR